MYNGNDFHKYPWAHEVITQGGWNKTNKVIMQNGRFDSGMFWWNRGGDVKWDYDTMLLDQLYDSRQRHNLDAMGKRYFGEGKWGEPKVLQAIKRGEFWTLPEATQNQYLYRDVELTWRVFHHLKSKLSTALWNLYEDFDNPVSHALCNLERVGFTIDVPQLEKWVQEYAEKFTTVQHKLQHAFGEVDVDSPEQVRKVLQMYAHMRIPDTRESTLRAIAPYCDAANLLLEYRETSKYYKTYLLNLYDRLYDGKVYPEFLMAGERKGGTETGRTSSANPNLQNQPRPGSGPINIRSLFLPRPGYRLIACDYNQLELKIAAFMSGEMNLLDGDIHQQAADILGVDRYVAKTTNFANIYGAGFPKLRSTAANSPKLPEYLEWWKRRFPKAALWTNKARAEAQDGCVRTYLGRVRFMDVSNAGPNTIVQGTGGDMGKEAVWRVQEHGFSALGLIHDEVIVEAPIEQVDEVATELPRIMTTGLKHHAEIVNAVGITASVKVGEHWGDMVGYLPSGQITTELPLR